MLGAEQRASRRAAALDDGECAANPMIVIDGRAGSAPQLTHLGVDQRDQRSIVVVIAGSATPAALIRSADVILSERGYHLHGSVEVDDPECAADQLMHTVNASVSASLALCWQLRLGHQLSVRDGLVAESATYSALLGGSGFASWLRRRPSARPSEPGPRIRVSRLGDELRITLCRTTRRNAVDTLMRVALLEALDIACWDECVNVIIDADGPHFCAGGDLDEFGSADDLAAAHVQRIAASVGQVLHRLRHRIVVHMHGDCVGAGVELPAFASRLVASPNARFWLPEIGMGLMPGAGGTVSLPRRITRTRTAWLALSGEPIDAQTALSWGLVDQIS
jgi:hypothetical protein